MKGNPKRKEALAKVWAVYKEARRVAKEKYEAEVVKIGKKYGKHGGK